MRSPFELMLPLMSHPARWFSDVAEGERARLATAPPRRWARHSQGMMNVLRQMARFAARAVASSATKSCAYRRYATAQPSSTIQPLMLVPATLHAATRRPYRSWVRGSQVTVRLPMWSARAFADDWPHRHGFPLSSQS